MAKRTEAHLSNDLSASLARTAARASIIDFLKVQVRTAPRNELGQIRVSAKALEEMIEQLGVREAEIVTTQLRERTAIDNRNFSDEE